MTPGDSGPMSLMKLSSNCHRPACRWRCQVLLFAAAVLQHAAAVPSPRVNRVESGHLESGSGKVNSTILLSSSTRVRREDPRTLAEYCQGTVVESEGAGMKPDSRVEADWHGYGTMYPGTVKKVNDHSMEILYDDGWEEEIKDENKDGTYTKVNPLPSEDAKPTEAPKRQPVDDPVCDLVDEIDATKVKVKDIFKDVAMWMASKRAQVAGKKLVVAPRSSGTNKSQEKAGAGAPAPAPAAETTPVPVSEEQAAELELLKKEIAEVDEQIRQLKQTVADNDELIANQAADSEEAKAKSQERTAEDLLEEYRQMLKQRKEELAKLQEVLSKQEQQLAAMGATPVSLEEIDKKVDELEGFVRKLKRKREEFEKAGKLDPELRALIDDLIDQAEKLRTKVDKLLEAEKAAREAEEAAAKAEAEAAAANKESAKEDKEAASEEATKEKDGKATAASQAAHDKEKELFKAAASVEEELDTISEDTEKLDTGIHPHGDKWWRYRYEHSFIEAMFMIFVLVLMLLWEKLCVAMRKKAYDLSEAEEHSAIVHGTLYIHWVEMVALELMACLAVFTTVWAIAKVELFDYIPLVLKGSDHLHLPHDGATYRRLAVDEVVILAASLVFYYTMTLSIVYQATVKLDKWSSYEVNPQSGRSVEAATQPARKAVRAQISRIATISVGEDEFMSMKTYFFSFLQNDPSMRETIQKYEKDTSMKVTEATFPFWLYLRLNVRACVDDLYVFGWTVWVPVILTFGILTCCHRFLHMGYIRIMLFFFLLQASLALLMFLLILYVSRQVEKMRSDEGEGEQASQKQSILADGERLVIWLMQYSGFFLGYGAARMVCQEWMWRLHFWPVVGFCVLLVILGFIYAYYLAPMIPTFAAAMALPPFVDKTNAEVVRDVLQEGSKPSTASA